MILKEKQLTNSQDPKIRAGEEAEKQMAFYLKRTFGKVKDCFVLHDLRIIHDGDVAQIDHLIVSRFGLFIVESKSVYGTININKQKEWFRTYNSRPQVGIGSPVLQAEAQGKVLKELLRANSEQLLSKVFGVLQKGFKFCPINVYAAISDNGIINRQVTIPELFKADQVANAIEEKLKSLKKSSSLLSLSPSDVGWSISVEETKKVADFLFHRHVQLLKINAENKTPLLSATAKPTNVLVNKVEVSFTPKVDAICPKCNQHKLIRKSISRSDGTKTEFLACEAYPKECRAIFALKPAIKIDEIKEIAVNDQKLIEKDSCPRCKSGKLVTKMNKVKKTTFVGCSEFPKCRFTA